MQRRVQAILVVLLAVAGTGLLAFGVIQLTSSDPATRPSDDAGTSTTTTTQTVPGELDGFAPDPERQLLTVMAPSLDRELAELTPVQGQDWLVESGTWRTSATGATAVNDGFFPAIATFDTSTTDGVLSVVAAAPAQRAGVVFGAFDAANAWRLEPNIDLDALFLVRLADGIPDTVGATGPIGLDDGYTVSIDVDGVRVRVLVDGVLEIDETDASFFFGTLVGLYGSPAPTEAPEPVWPELTFTRRLPPDALALPPVPG